MNFEGNFCIEFWQTMENRSSLASDFDDLQGSMPFHHLQDPQTESAIPSDVQELPISFIDCSNDERGKSLVIDDNYFMNEVVEVGEGMGSPWQRIKWTEKMVKLLITAVSYIRQYALSFVGSGSNEYSLLQKIRKWKLVSKVMVERGYHVSPQQCEDKFNNLNKRYKRLNDVLGRGICCKVVENPKLLDEMDLSEKAKEGVRRILSSKQLFYEEMCSYHNGNQLYLPHDPDLRRSLQLVIEKKDEYHDNQSTRWSEADNFDKQGQDAGADVCPERNKVDELEKQWMEFRSCRLRVQNLQIKAEILKVEKQQFKWQRIWWKKERKMKKMRLENECLKIENERMAMELKFKEMSADYNLSA